jgi:hypothetical protein
MRKLDLIKFYESEVLNETLPVEIRHGAAKELSILRKWRASLTTTGAFNVARARHQRRASGAKKWEVFQQWLEQRCPKEYRRPAIDGGIDKTIRDWMFVYVKRMKRSKFSLNTLDEAFQKFVEQQQQAQAGNTGE